MGIPYEDSANLGEYVRVGAHFFVFHGGVWLKAVVWLTAPTIAHKLPALKNYFADFRKSLAAVHLELKYFLVDTPQTMHLAPRYFPVDTLRDSCDR